VLSKPKPETELDRKPEAELDRKSETKAGPAQAQELETRPQIQR